MKKQRTFKENELKMLRFATEKSQGDIKRQELAKIGSMKRKVEVIKLEGKSLYLFSPDNKMRIFLSKVIAHPVFDNFILVLILISTILLTLDSPLDDPKSNRVYVLDIFDTVMTVLFIIELLVKNIVFGFACNGPQSYIRGGWNMMDGLIVLLSIFKFLPIDAELGFIKVMRLLRVIRPLRLLTKYQGMRVAVESLIKSIPGFGNVLVISALMILLFSILGTTFYKGLFHTCHMDNVPKDSQQFIASMWSCLDYGGEWV
jgi:voltage-dependent calcium channel T type alpha-1G